MHELLEEMLHKSDIEVSYDTFSRLCGWIRMNALAIALGGSEAMGMGVYWWQSAMNHSTHSANGLMTSYRPGEQRRVWNEESEKWEVWKVKDALKATLGPQEEVERDDEDIRSEQCDCDSSENSAEVAETLEELQNHVACHIICKAAIKAGDEILINYLEGSIKDMSAEEAVRVLDYQYNIR